MTMATGVDKGPFCTAVPVNFTLDLRAVGGSFIRTHDAQVSVELNCIRNPHTLLLLSKILFRPLTGMSSFPFLSWTLTLMIQ